MSTVNAALLADYPAEVWDSALHGYESTGVTRAISRSRYVWVSQHHTVAFAQEQLERMAR